MLQTKVADTAPQEHPEILVVEHAEASAATLEQSVTPRMKSAGLQTVDGSTLQFSADASQHFRRRVFRVGEGNNFVGARVTFADEIGHALGEDGSLPGAGSGDHQHRPMNVSDGLLLAFIGNDVGRGRGSGI